MLKLDATPIVGRSQPLTSGEQLSLLSWFDRESRDLPWRQTGDSYAIWVSEIMLQQTQVSTVIPYWLKWMERFPTIEELAEANEQEVLSLWQGLGYYRRCRMLLQGAKWVVENGTPATADGWIQVPGVGPYTAGAIASIAFQEPSPLVDGNVERVYARLTGDASAGPLLKANAWKWAKSNLFKERPGDWNQALMELGATVCRPSPDCPRCPLSTRCFAYQEGKIDELPAKPPKVKTAKLMHAVWAPWFEEKFGVTQIPAGQWWEGMWEFPRVDSDGAQEPCELREVVGPGWVESLGTIKHSVTHHRIVIAASLVRCESPSRHLRWVSGQELDVLPMPAPQRKIAKMAINLLGA